MTEGELERIRLVERLAILDEVHDDVAHHLALASIHLGVLERCATGRSAEAPAVVNLACRRTLDGLRRARRMTSGRATESPAWACLDRLAAQARKHGARLEVAPDLPPAEELSPGLIASGVRAAEVLLHVTAGRRAVAAMSCRRGVLRVRVESTLAVDAWPEHRAELERVRERVRWFGGTLRVEPGPRGSQATVTLAP